MARSKPDDGLRPLLHSGVAGVHWQAVETGLTGAGVPDSNGCAEGVEFWVESKATDGWAVKFEVFQVGWHLRRTRHGGRTFVAVRRRHDGGPRRGPAVDELWLFAGAWVRELSDGGLLAAPPIGRWTGGPARWDWAEVRDLLLG